MDDAWNKFVEKKQRKCYELMLRSLLMIAGSVMIAGSFYMPIANHFDRVACDIAMSIGIGTIIAVLFNQTPLPLWARGNKHNRRT